MSVNSNRVADNPSTWIATNKSTGVAIVAPNHAPATYSDLATAMDEAEQAFRDAGAKSGDRIAVLSSDALVTATAVIAGSAIGQVAPISPKLSNPELGRLIRYLTPRLLVCDPASSNAGFALARDTGVTLVLLDHQPGAPAGQLMVREVLQAENMQYRHDQTSAFDCAVILSTSGTTAAPRWVCWTHAMIARGAQLVADALALSSTDRCLAVMPFYHGHGLMACLLATLKTGGTVILPPAFDASQFFNWCEAQTPTWYSAVPSIHQAILAQALWCNESKARVNLRFIRSSSAALPHRVRCELESLFSAPVIEALGMTEATHQVASNTVDPQRRRPGSVGQVTGVEAVIRTASQEIASPNQIGELMIRGSTVVSAYLDDPVEARHAFANGWLCTGDRAYCDEDGFIFVVGRSKHLINRAGESISPYEIEAVLFDHPAVEHAAAFGRPHPILGEEVAAVVTPKKGFVPDPRDLKKFAANRLVDYKTPTTLVVRDTIPLSAVGKVQRGLLAGLIESADTPGPEADPDPDILRVVEQIWCEVLGQTSIPPTASFLELGGDSLASVRVLARVKHELGVESAIADIFGAPTLARFAEIVASQGGMAGKSNNNPAGQIMLDPAGRFETFPLTDLQQAYWVGRGDCFSLGGVSCHAYAEYDLVQVDLARLEVAWARLVEHHDCLRLVILGGERQQVLEQTPYPHIPIEDLRSLSSDVVESSLQQTRRRMSHQVRPADQWPLFEIQASQFDDERYRLHVSLDGLILDAPSRGILFQEWARLYADAKTVLDPHSHTFRDLVLTELQGRKSANYARAEAYWRSRFGKIADPPELPVADDRKGPSPAKFKRLSARIDGTSLASLRRRTTSAGLTITTVTLTAFAEVICSWARSPHFTLNLPIINRAMMRPITDQILGPRASSIPLVVDFSKVATFLKRARMLQSQLCRDLDHSTFGGVQAMRALRETRSSSQPMILPVVFTSIPGTPAFGLFENETYGVSQTPQVSIDVHVQDRGDTIILNWNWVPGAFAAGIGEAMFASYRTLLRRLASDEGYWHALAPARDPPVAPVVLTRGQNNEDVVRNETLPNMFACRAAMHPDAPALISEAYSLSYAELDLEASKLAAMVEREDLDTTRPVAIIMQHRHLVPIAMLAILKVGTPFVCIDSVLPDRRIARILARSGTSLALKDTHETSWECLVSLRVIRVGETIAPDVIAKDTVEPLKLANPDEDACLVFTSGTTGEPKGVPFTHRGILRAVIAMNRELDIGPGDCAIAVSNFDHDMALYDVFGLWEAGGAVMVPNTRTRRDPARLLELMRTHQATLWCSVPATMEMLVDKHEIAGVPPLTRLRSVVLGGDRIPPTLPGRVAALAPAASMLGVGGPTETTIWSVVHEIDPASESRRPIPYGRAFAGARYLVVTEALEERPVWAIGEMACAGPGVVQGYWRDPAETKRRFVNHPITGERLYLTGDIGRYRADGLIDILGRDDGQIKINGNRIELGEIDAVLSGAANVATSITVAVQQGERPPGIVSFVTPVSGAAIDISSVWAIARANLQDCAVPVDIIILTDMPLTRHGKVDKTALQMRAEQTNQAVLINRSTPEVVSDRVAAIVREVLGVITNGAAFDQDLLALGATSVDVVRILNRLQRDFACRPDVDAMFANLSITGLASLVADQNKVIVNASCTVALKGENLVDDDISVQIDDPEDRSRFRKSAAQRRGATMAHAPSLIALSPPESKAYARLRRRRSHRRFLSVPIDLLDFSRFLGVLGVAGDSRRYYPSSGGLYSIDIFAYIKHDRIENLPGGTYHYDPHSNQLAAIQPGAEIDPCAYSRLQNRPIFEASAFALYFVANDDAIVPLYGERSRDLLHLDAGYIGQLLHSEAAAFGLGLCPIGTLAFDKVRDRFGLDPEYWLVHSMVGGLPREVSDAGDAP